MRKTVLLSFLFAACAASAASAADKPVHSTNIKASANVLSGKQNAKVQLSPAGAALNGQSPIDLAKEALE